MPPGEGATTARIWAEGAARRNALERERSELRARLRSVAAEREAEKQGTKYGVRRCPTCRPLPARDTKITLGDG